MCYLTAYMLQEWHSCLLISDIWNTHRISLFAFPSFIWAYYHFSLIMPSKLRSCCWKQHPRDTGKSTICWITAAVSCSTLDFCKEVPRVTFITNTWKELIRNLRAWGLGLFSITLNLHKELQESLRKMKSESQQTFLGVDLDSFSI